MYNEMVSTANFIMYLISLNPWKYKFLTGKEDLLWENLCICLKTRCLKSWDKRCTRRNENGRKLAILPTIECKLIETARKKTNVNEKIFLALSDIKTIIYINPGEVRYRRIDSWGRVTNYYLYCDGEGKPWTADSVQVQQFPRKIDRGFWLEHMKNVAAPEEKRVFDESERLKDYGLKLIRCLYGDDDNWVHNVGLISFNQDEASTATFPI